LKVISLWQPFASLIFAGVKGFETRSFYYPKKLMDKRIAIHATAKFTPKSMVSDDLDELCIRTFGENYRDTLPRSAILGTVRLDGAYGTEMVRGYVSDDEITAGDWSDGRVVWKLGAVERLAAPLTMSGRQGWWSWDAQ